MNKFFKKICLSILVLLITFTTCISIKSKAQEFRGTYDYDTEIYVRNDSYFIKINPNVNFNDIMIKYGGINYFEEDLYIIIDNKLYDSYVLDITFGSVYFAFYNTNDDSQYPLINYGNLNIVYNGRLPLYSGENYVFRLYPVINELFIFENYVNGYYTFNTSINDIQFSRYNFIEPTQEFKLTGSLVYPSDDYYLFYAIETTLNGEVFSFLMFTPRGDSYFLEVLDFFNEDTDYLRYLYLDTQYIDTLLYEFLILNGDFKYSVPQGFYNVTFWDLINSYVNIPSTIIHNILNISIFNTSVTLLAVFGSILAIALAIKIAKMVI